MPKKKIAAEAVAPIVVKKRRASGAGVKTDDSVAPLVRKQILFDEATTLLFTSIGKGNVSLGAREAARRLSESGDIAPFDYDRHCARARTQPTD